MSDTASIDAIVESGAAAVSAGAVEAGVLSLRNAVRLADAAGAPDLRVRSRLVLAEALVHSVGGLDEDGLAYLHEADEIALAQGDNKSVAHARSEIGYVDFLRARYDRAERWLSQALQFADGAPSMIAKAQTYLGSVASDRGDYPRAVELLVDAQRHAQQASDLRRETFVLSMLGRVSLLRGELAKASEHLVASIELAERDHWLAIDPAVAAGVAGRDPPTGSPNRRGRRHARAAVRTGVPVRRSVLGGHVGAWAGPRSGYPW